MNCFFYFVLFCSFIFGECRIIYNHTETLPYFGRIDIEPRFDQGLKLILYDHANYGGDSKTVELSDSGCSDVLDFNDRASSVKLTSGGCIRLWEHSKCNGKSLDVDSPGESFLPGRDFNDKTTSVSSCDFPHYKEEVEIEIHLDCANDLREHAEQAKRIMQEWFPFIQSQLYTPAYRNTPKIDLYYDDKDLNGNDFVAYALGPTIHVSKGYIRRNLGDFGMYIHEMTHVIHSTRNCPGWVVEGTAEYMRRWFYEPATTPTKPTNQNLDNAYIGDWLLYYLTTVMNKPIFYQITKACQEGSYTDNWLRDRTGKTPEEWWKEMVNNDSFPWKRVR